jgi:hypothetical protein
MEVGLGAGVEAARRAQHAQPPMLRSVRSRGDLAGLRERSRSVRFVASFLHGCTPGIGVVDDDL